MLRVHRLDAIRPASRDESTVASCALTRSRPTIEI